MYPSSPSVSAASAKSAAAITSPLGVSSSSATTITGTATIRSIVSALGMLTGTTGGAGY